MSRRSTTRGGRGAAARGTRADLQQAAARLRAGDTPAAMRLLDRRFSGREERATALHLRGLVAVSAGRAGEAVGALREALSLDDRPASRWADLAQALWQAESFEAAAEALGQALARQPGEVAWLQARGACLQQTGDLDAAVQTYMQALQVAPREAALHYNLGTALKRQHRLAAAASAYAAAHELAPDAPDVAYSLGVCLVEQGDFEAAVPALEAARSAGLEDAASLVMLGYAYTKLGRGEDAVRCCTRACELAPADTGALAGLGSAQLAAGDAPSALQSSERLLQRQPGDPTALSNKTIALVELGQLDAASELAGLDRFVLQRDLAAPEGHADIQAFNDAVLEHLLNHPRVELDRSSLSCHEGTTSGEILLDPLGPVGQLEALIRDTAEQYVAALRAPPDHPFAASRPGRTQLSAWLTVLRDQGYQHGHIHALAWLSGVYYLRIPEGVGGGEDGRDGWLEFGRPPYYYRTGAQHPTRALQPRAGRLYMFPSYLYHRTLPFRGTEPRISIAFDFQVRP